MNKVTIIGSGRVGSTIAYSLTCRGLAQEIVIIDIAADRAMGEAQDIRQGLSYDSSCIVYAGNYEDAKGSDIVIITSGIARKPGQSRLELIQTNIGIQKSIIPQITKYAPDAVYIMVSNPVDILTYTALKLSGFPENRVIGSGTVLDTARLKYALSEHLGVDSRSVHSFIIGEHGDSEIAAWSSTNVSGIPLNTFCEMRGHYNHDAAMDRIAEEVKNSAYDIISKKQATYYGIAMSIKLICECIIRNERSILPISSMMHGEYGISGISLSMPAIVGLNGIETHVPISLDADEAEKLRESAETLKKIAAELDLSAAIS